MRSQALQRDIFWQPRMRPTGFLGMVWPATGRVLVAMAGDCQRVGAEGIWTKMTRKMRARNICWHRTLNERLRLLNASTPTSWATAKLNAGQLVEGRHTSTLASWLREWNAGPNAWQLVGSIGNAESLTFKKDEQAGEKTKCRGGRTRGGGRTRAREWVLSVSHALSQCT